MVNNPILRVRAHHTNVGGTVAVTRYRAKTKHVHTCTSRIDPVRYQMLREFLLMLDRNHKGRFRNHGNGYSYLAWQGRNQNAS